MYVMMYSIMLVLQGSPASKHDNLCHLLQKISVPEK